MNTTGLLALDLILGSLQNHIKLNEILDLKHLL